MTRALFLARLRDGLSGMSHDEIADIMADYEAHFADGAAAGRSEADVAASLGDPARLARELRAEASIKHWEADRSPGTFMRAGLALLGLVTIDFFILLPLAFALLLAVGIALFVLSILGSVGAGLAASIFHGGIGGFAVAMVGLAMLSGVIGAGALVLILLGWAMQLAARYARLHYRLIDKSQS